MEMPVTGMSAKILPLLRPPRRSAKTQWRSRLSHRGTKCGGQISCCTLKRFRLENNICCIKNGALAFAYHRILRRYLSGQDFSDYNTLMSFHRLLNLQTNVLASIEWLHATCLPVFNAVKGTAGWSLHRELADEFVIFVANVCRIWIPSFRLPVLHFFIYIGHCEFLQTSYSPNVLDGKCAC